MSEIDKQIEQCLSLQISQDWMEAKFKCLSEPAGFTKEDLRAYLSERMVTQGVLENGLEEALKLAPGNTAIVAKGTPVQATVQPRIDYFFPLTEDVEVAEKSDGSVDFREIGRFNNFEAGAILAIKTPGREGVQGMDIRGKCIEPEKLKDIKIPVGKMVELSEDGTQALAKSGGHACRVDGKITILSRIQIPGDIDYSTGNIRFLGDVDVAGNILAGFQLEVGGTLTVRENIENATIRVGKDLIVNGTVFGKSGTVIVVNGNASFREVDSAALDVMGDLVVKNAIRHSTIRCGGNIEITSKNGVIVGGEVSALRTIKAANLGSNMGTLTRITVGTNPFIHQEIDQIEKRLEVLRTKLSQVDTHLQLMDKKVAKGDASPTLQELHSKLTSAKATLKKEIAACESSSNELRQKLVELGTAHVEVQDTLYSGVVITVRRSKARTYDEHRRVRAEEEAGEVKFFPI
ncbi:MAG: DUF342 domain-containing protein [bacterium]|jgi:hypothetical protein